MLGQCHGRNSWLFLQTTRSSHSYDLNEVTKVHKVHNLGMIVHCVVLYTIIFVCYTWYTGNLHNGMRHLQVYLWTSAW